MKVRVFETQKFAIFIDHRAPCFPKTFCVTILFDFSLDDCYTQEKLETVVMKNVRVNKVRYGLCENAQCPSRTFTTKNPVFFLFYFPFFVLSTNICNIRVQLLLICFSLKKDNAYKCMQKWF